MIDPVAYMTQRNEPAPEVAEAEAAYAAAVKDLHITVPAELRDKVLDLESAASAYAVALAEHYFFAGLAAGLVPDRLKEMSDAD